MLTWEQCKPKSAEEIYSELAESRACYERGGYEELDDALADISKNMQETRVITEEG